MKDQELPVAGGSEGTTQLGVLTRRAIHALLLFSAGALLGGVTSASVEEVADQPPASESESCQGPLILGLHEDADEGLVEDLSRVAGLRLDLLRVLQLRLVVVAPEAAVPAAQCAAAIDRLRRDPRVRFVEADARRELHEP